MDQNTAAISALLEYTKIKKPGYAFMLEAPWGAGKTYLVKHEFKDLFSRERARYITLNGVSDRKSFRRALLANTPASKLAGAAGQFGNAIGSIANVGNVGNLIQNGIEDKMIESLPNLLIFDDVERCEINPKELLGLLNEFVEHQTKNVVLCAFIERNETNEERKKRDDFLSRKEKVVGRTVRIVADAGSAVPNFISTMPDGHGKRWFESNVEIAIEVFLAAKNDNLRVLRQCIHDCGRVIDVLEAELRASTDAMIRFVRTFLVLSMALAANEIKSAHLSERSDHQWFSKPAEGASPHPLYTCFKKNPQAEIFAGNSASILPRDLGVSLIGIGYESPGKINEALRATGQFSGENDVPLWRRFIHWRQMPLAELEKTYREARNYVFENDEIEPGPYLHLAHDLILIADDGFGTAATTAKDIECRIKAIAKNNSIPAATYGSGYGWSTETGDFSFGGFAFTPNEYFEPILKAMRTAQLAAFRRSLPEEAKRLLGLLRDDLEAFGREFSGSYEHGGYRSTAILHKIDSNEFADAIFDHMTSGEFDEVGAQLKALGDRHRPSPITEELPWAKEVKEKLIDLAEKSGSLAKAQMSRFIGYYWRFDIEEPNDA